MQKFNPLDATISFIRGGGSSSIAWGDISGTLASQTDLQTALDAKVDENGAITGATKTKITFDSKGLVTSGSDATTTDIAEGSNLYFTDERVDDRVSSLLQGTSSQITVTYNDGSNTLTLSTPQNIATTSTPSFAGLTLTSTGTSTLKIAYDGSNYAEIYADSLGIIYLAPTAKSVNLKGTAVITRETTVTTLTQAVVFCLAKTSNDMADGFGATFRFDIMDNAGVQNNIAQIGGRRDGADNQGALTFLIVDGSNGLIEAGRFNHSQNFGIGTTVPETKLHIAKASGSGGHGSITIEEESSTPSNPTSGTHSRIYMKADKLIIQFNDGGTVRYKYLDLTGTTTTWTHTTTAP